MICKSLALACPGVERALCINSVVALKNNFYCNFMDVR